LSYSGRILLLLLTLLPLSASSQPEDCKDRVSLPGQPLAYCGDLRSMALINIRNVMLEEVYKGLNRPWAMEFIASDELLITESSGSLKRLNLVSGEIQEVTGGPTIPQAEGKQVALLDIALHPQFGSNQRIYLSHVAEQGEGWYRKFTTAVSTAILAQGKLEGLQQIFAALPYEPSPAQFGGAMDFDDQGYLYVATGDRGTKGPALHRGNTIGKVLRLTDSGEVPSDNPFLEDPLTHDAIYALGVRNPQGLRFDPLDGQLYEAEHGPMGGDEVNVVVRGLNYGWPAVSYGANYNTEEAGVATEMAGMQPPLYFYLPSIAPSPIEVYRGDMFPEWNGYLLVGALKARYVSLLAVKNGAVLSEQRILDEARGRIRDIKVGPDGAVYLLVQNGGRVLRLRRDTSSTQLDQPRVRSGARIFGYICSSCHSDPASAMPQLTDLSYWQPRLDGPVKTQYEAVLRGSGDMPARGLCENCSDQEIRDAVDYLLEQVRSAR
jgi:glucose/arabinose dehydrogenase/cytochrome c5